VVYCGIVTGKDRFIVRVPCTPFGGTRAPRDIDPRVGCVSPADECDPVSRDSPTEGPPHVIPHP